MRFDSIIPAAEAQPAAYTDTERRIPRGSTLEGDVLVPFLQSVITGAIGALVSWTFWEAPLPGFAVGFALCWLILLVQTRSLLREVERVTRRDLDGDGVVGPPEPGPPAEHILRIEMADSHGQVRRAVNLRSPVPPDRLADLAAAALRGDSLAEGVWGGPGKAFSLDEFRALREELIGARILEWRNPRAHNQGTRVVDAAAARHVLERLAKGEGE